MMGYMFATGRCLICKELFPFNPEKVPSSSIITGTKEPICAICFDRINVKRKAKGLPPFVAPPGAYEPEKEGLH